jgi:predicted dehydrogenase
MVRTCKEHGVTLAVAYYRRGYPSIQRAKALLKSGAIGEVRSISLNTQFPISHRLDLVQYFCGDISSVQLQKNASGDFDLRGTTASGATLRTSLGFEETVRTEQVRIEGTGGTVFVDDLKGGSLILKRQENEKKESFGPLPATHWGLVENFRDHLRNGDELICDGATGSTSSVVLDVVSNLTHPEEELGIDYNNPPTFNLSQGAEFKLLA